MKIIKVILLNLPYILRFAKLLLTFNLFFSIFRCTFAKDQDPETLSRFNPHPNLNRQLKQEWKSIRGDSCVPYRDDTIWVIVKKNNHIKKVKVWKKVKLG